MSFKLLHKAINYQEHVEAINSSGLCLGQTWLWMSEIISGVSGTLSPPNFFAGGKIHREYRERFRVAALSFIDMKASELISIVPEKCLEQRKAKGYASAVALVNEFSVATGGNAVVYMAWGLNAHKITLNKVFCQYESGHAMGLLRLKNNGKIYLYDPNIGVFEWVKEPGVKLKTDIKRFMLQSPGRSMAAMMSAMMLSTKSDIPLNFEHVIV